MCSEGTPHVFLFSPTKQQGIPLCLLQGSNPPANNPPTPIILDRGRGKRGARHREHSYNASSGKEAAHLSIPLLQREQAIKQGGSELN